MIELIPAIDIIEGKCVRLVQGQYQQKKTYSDQPLQVARHFAGLGVRRLHLVDLDGAKAGKVVNLDILQSIAEDTALVIDFGGGIKSDEDIQSVFDAGAAMITAGSIAVKDRAKVEKWLAEYGPEKIILGADTRDGKISINAWQEDTTLGIFDFVQGYMNLGINRLICTDIARDGMLGGTALDLYKALKDRFPSLEIIASGGVSGMEDIRELDQAGIDGVIFGKAFYEGNITSQEIVEFFNE
ncbi:MAG: 1-(5-phosphoribosyl)-5-[(5-phosphoribosylamino)methylideneamino]imidazole-4-carboxamide isomerase [Bacteroidales bacterium]|nr:1-(5-phosphoribosyl)-5-[(5-phosphoribosylamino)methylideneamino]imidazole-4-carboxamide isomerase [Bacteroidales bacterium]